jgi:hypothetical protein
VRERRCFVQFIHPGGEHWPDRGDRKFWNQEAHRRKFLKGRGRYITGGEAREGEIVFSVPSKSPCDSTAGRAKPRSPWSYGLQGKKLNISPTGASGVAAK